MTWLRRIVKTVVICLGAVGLIALALLYRRRDAVGEAVTETRQRLDEVKHTAAVEVAAARRNEQELKGRLRAATAISDRMRRRQELLDLYREVSR